YQNYEHIRANNNVIHFDISPSGAHYDNYPYYFYYITEAKNNVVENKQGYYNRVGYMCRIGNTSSCAGYASTGDIDNHNNTEAGASENIEADPMFVDAANYNFAFTNPDLNASAFNMNITKDFNGDI